jgi:hypothetical protein
MIRITPDSSLRADPADGTHARCTARVPRVRFSCMNEMSFRLYFTYEYAAMLASFGSH